MALVSYSHEGAELFVEGDVGEVIRIDAHKARFAIKWSRTGARSTVKLVRWSRYFKIIDEPQPDQVIPDEPGPISGFAEQFYLIFKILEKIDEKAFVFGPQTRDVEFRISEKEFMEILAAEEAGLNLDAAREFFKMIDEDPR